MLGKVILEECFELPEKEEEWINMWGLRMFPDAPREGWERLKDISGKRLELHDKYAVGYQILSYQQPGIQDIIDPKKAEAEAKRVNGYIAKDIKGHGDRLGAFA